MSTIPQPESILDRLERLMTDATTPPMWRIEGRTVYSRHDGSDVCNCTLSTDAELIAEMRNALPALIRDLRRALEALDG